MKTILVENRKRAVEVVKANVINGGQVLSTDETENKMYVKLGFNGPTVAVIKWP